MGSSEAWRRRGTMGKNGSPPRPGRSMLRASAWRSHRRICQASNLPVRRYRPSVERNAQGVAEAEQTWRIEDTRREHAEKLLAQHSQRRARLVEERGNLVHPEAHVMADLELRIGVLDEALEHHRLSLAAAEQSLPECEQAARDATAELEHAAQELAGFTARLQALEQLQSRVGNGEQLGAWRLRHGIDALPRLWQGIDIEAGWEDALESVLRERLDAVEVEDVTRSGAWFDDRPPGKLALFGAHATPPSVAFAAPDRGLPPLVDFVQCRSPAVRPVLEEWLARVYLVEDGATALAAHDRLEPGELIVSRDGHLFTRYGIVFHAPESELHGVLSRQREIEQLRASPQTGRLPLRPTPRPDAAEIACGPPPGTWTHPPHLEERQARHRAARDLRLAEQADRARGRRPDRTRAGRAR